MEYIRKIKVFKTYYKEFYLAQTPEVRTKIDYVIELIKQLDRVPKSYFKQIEGQKGTPERNDFERGAEAFILAERLKEERLKAGLTQEQLAAKIGTKKTYISRIENGKADVQHFRRVGEKGQSDYSLKKVFLTTDFPDLHRLSILIINYLILICVNPCNLW